MHFAFVAVIILSKSSRDIVSLSRLLKSGTVVAAPTETAYGLLADSTNKKAIKGIVRLKGRRENKPVPLVAADLAMVRRYCQMTKNESRLAKKFWPGPLTLVLKAKKKFPCGVVAPDGTVGIRVSGSVWLRKISARLDKPLVATSANKAGGETTYSAQAVKRALSKQGLNYLVDGGALKKRPTSTVVRVQKDQLTIFREGTITRAQLMRVLGFK